MPINARRIIIVINYSVLLSSCINTISVSCRKSIEATIGPKQLEHVLSSKPVPTFSEYVNPEWAQLKLKIQEASNPNYDNLMI